MVWQPPVCSTSRRTFITGTIRYCFGMTMSLQLLTFLLIFLAFAVKIPMFPFHTWLPDAHTDAPTEVSVILAGILLKMGAYGLIRICFTLFPVVFMSLRLAGGDRGHQYYLWRGYLSGADGYEEADCLFQCQPHGYYSAGCCGGGGSIDLVHGMLNPFAWRR